MVKIFVDRFRGKWKKKKGNTRFITCRAGRESHHAELNRVLGEVILIQEAVQLALALALAQTAHRAIHSLGVLPPPEIRVGDDQADRHLGGSPVPSSRREPRRVRVRRSPAIGGGDQRAEDHEDLDPHLSSPSSSSFLPSFLPSPLRSGESGERGNSHSFPDPFPPRNFAVDLTSPRINSSSFISILLRFDLRVRRGWEEGKNESDGERAIFFPHSGHRSKNKYTSKFENSLYLISWCISFFLNRSRFVSGATIERNRALELSLRFARHPSASDRNSSTRDRCRGSFFFFSFSLFFFSFSKKFVVCLFYI